MTSASAPSMPKGTSPSVAAPKKSSSGFGGESRRIGWKSMATWSSSLAIGGWSLPPPRRPDTLPYPSARYAGDLHFSIASNEQPTHLYVICPWTPVVSARYDDKRDEEHGESHFRIAEASHPPERHRLVGPRRIRHTRPEPAPSDAA